MKLPFAWVTDPHLDHLNGIHFRGFIRDLANVPETMIIITGDITTGARLTADLTSLAEGVSSAGKQIYFVLGNHDLWNETIEGARRLARDVAQRHTNLIYLPTVDPIQLGPFSNEYLIGVNGYGDARGGNFALSNVSLVDYRLCASLRGLSKDRLQRVLQDLGEESAFEFSEAVAKLPSTATRLYLATHVPPFVEAHWFKDIPATDDFTPHFVNVALGREILHTAKMRPELDIVVLAGHVHWGTRVRMAPNVVCYVGWAEYGQPAVQDLHTIPDRTKALS